MKTIIIEDSRLARKELVELLKKHPHISICSEVENIEQALESIQK